MTNNHRYPRFYFRCAYRDEHGCSAKKQVQQTEDDPSLFDVTYFGDHTTACPRDAPVPRGRGGRHRRAAASPHQLHAGRRERQVVSMAVLRRRGAACAELAGGGEGADASEHG
uniref:WRKY domain-containing protein n=1 Tax=Arundo donax TaxID=35708 RepID=A0A0A9HU71_ARUDO